jgi:hypothetical protein
VCQSNHCRESIKNSSTPHCSEIICRHMSTISAQTPHLLIASLRLTRLDEIPFRAKPQEQDRQGGRGGYR